MKKSLLALFIVSFSLLHAFEFPDPEEGVDEFTMLLSIPTYVACKAIEFAKEHHFRYLKILSFELDADEHHINYINKNEASKGKYFEIKDGSLSIGLVCFRGKPSDPQTIDVKKYQSLVDEVIKEISQSEEPNCFGGAVSKSAKSFQILKNRRFFGGP